MLLLGSSFAKFQILSLRANVPVGTVIGHIINPHKLRVDALWCKVPQSRAPQILLRQDIREISPKGIIVDDLDVIVPREDMIRLESIIELKFELLGKKVISGRFPLGKVVDYAVDRDGFVIQKLYVEPTILGRIKSSRLTVDRAQIVEVSPQYVRVKGSEVKEPVTEKSIRPPQLSPSPSANASVIDE
jgi:hypothetical protein